MKQLPYYNDHPHAVFIGAVMIPPGHTRLVDAALLPQPEPTPIDPPPPTDPLVELLKGNVSQIVAGLDGLSIEELTRLGDLEQTGGQRKGVLSAIAEHLLKESSQQQGGGLGQLSPKQTDTTQSKQKTKQEQGEA